MPTFPAQPQDPFELANQSVRGITGDSIPGFGATNRPLQSGFATPSSNIPNERGAIQTRSLIRWFVPEVGVVEMYINPQSISYQFKKSITNVRTKGGFTLQYWGEDLTQLSINGTTGSSGIEGINVLEDVYRAEQNAYDPFALAVAAQIDAENNDALSVFGGFGDILSGIGNQFTSALSAAVQTGSPVISRPQPTLASLAFSVEMYYSGWVFRGYFTDFRVDERAEKLGLFDYAMTFVVTQRRGLRTNFLGWHRSATSGPSNSDPEFGVPYSYKGLYTEQATPSRLRSDNSVTTLGDVLETGAGLVSNAFSSIF